MHLFQNKIFIYLFTIPVSFACLSLFTIPTHRKSPEQFTSTDRMLVTPDPVLHELAVDRDYLSFAVHNGGYMLFYAIFQLIFSGFIDLIFPEGENHKEKD
jgi:hypothetical protein